MKKIAVMEFGLVVLGLLASVYCLPQAPDPSPTVAADMSTALYPLYTYTPAVGANYAPKPHGLQLTQNIGTANSTDPRTSPNPYFDTLTVAACPLLPTKPSTYWYEAITHNGISPFISGGASWKVFRNVKSFGVVGDGVTNDETAFQNAINSGNRGAVNNGLGTTGAPAVVYVPSGTYIFNSPIQLFLDTVLIGNPLNPPVIKASASFSGNTLIYAKDPRQDSTTNFYIGIKNVNFDSTAISASTSFTLIDWSVSQATQLTNCAFKMPTFSSHTGIAMPEGGSGTMMGDLSFTGGKYGINMNNQQYNVKSSKFNGCNVGIYVSHCFDCIFQNLDFMNCGTAVNMTSGGDGSVALIDSSVSSVGTVVATKATGNGDHSLVIENLSVTNSGSTVVASGSTILTGSVADTWVYGNAYVPGGPITGSFQSGTFYATPRPAALLSNGKYFLMAPPTYQQYSVDQVVNIKLVPGLPVYGDGKTDDTANINAILTRNAGCAITFFPAGTYLVSNTINVPAGSRIVGEVWSAISATGARFQNANSPIPMVRVGNPGDVGTAQISDMLFTTATINPGLILVEVNMAGASRGDVGFWNSHFRVGGAAGSAVETSCTGSPANCMAAFLMLRLTPSSSAYIEDMWGWTADHDLDGSHAQNIATGRGILVESTKATWLVGTAFEHNTLYQYNIVNAQNVFIGMQQCETPYWQGNGSPALAPAPWTANTVAFHDPNFANCAAGDAQCRMAWYQRISGGSNIFIYGSGFWTFFNYYTGCSGTCQTNAAEVVSGTTALYWYTLNTKSCLNMLVNNGAVLCTQNNNPGSWGGIVAAMRADT